MTICQAINFKKSTLIVDISHIPDCLPEKKKNPKLEMFLAAKNITKSCSSAQDMQCKKLSS